MKNYFRKVSMLTIALLIVLSSCKKDDAAKTPKDFLTAGYWKVTGMEFNPGIDIGGGVVITDVFDLIVPACVKDDLLKFNTNGTLTEDEGATKCDPDDPQTITDGTWTLSDDGKTLTITYPNGQPEVATVTTLNETTLKISTSLTIDLGTGEITYTATITMEMQ